MITSVNNPQVKDVVALQQKGRYRKERGLYVTEGSKMLWEADPKVIENIYVTEAFLAQEGVQEKLHVLQSKGNATLETVTEDVMHRMSDTKTPQGVLCLQKQKQYTQEDILGELQSQPQGKLQVKPQEPLVLILENLQDPGNVGTIFRTAEGAGVTGIILAGDCVDVYHPKTIRSTMGSIYRVPFIYEETALCAMQNLRRSGIRIYASYLEGSVPYTEPDYQKGCAIAIGNESAGLSKEAIEEAGICIRIPMQGQLESLNAAIATAILVYEVARQRSL